MKKTHQKIIAAALLSATGAGSLHAATTAFYRLEGAVDAGITSASDSSGNGIDSTSITGAPTFSSDTVAPFIFDPTTGQTLSNTTSLNGSTGNARVNVASNAAFNSTSFTVEGFIKVVGQPNSFDSFIRRNGGNGSRWQIDFDHGGTGPGFGRGRSRFNFMDNAGGVDRTVRVNNPDDANYLFVDTAAGDGIVANYGPSDVADEGDDLNDNPVWHHVAITFDGLTNTATYFIDYVEGSSATVDGFAHPDAALQFGHLSGTGAYGLFIDELKYSDEALDSSQFLQASPIPEPSSTLLALISLVGVIGRRRR